MRPAPAAAAATADVVVVGGGPAGLAAALELRARELDVLVLDARRPPADKACGEGLMPDGLARLRALGVELPPGETAPFRGIRYVDGGTMAEGRFPAGSSGLGVRRTTLHAALVSRAEAAGVRLAWGERVTGLLREGDGADGEVAGVVTARGPIRARWTLGADGLRSRVRVWAGLETAHRAARRRRGPAAGGRFGVRRHYRLAPWSELVEVHWADGAEAYVTPVGGEAVGVAVLWSGRAAGFDEHLERFPALAARLAGAPALSSDRGAGPLAQPVRRAVRGRVALVGDAAGYVDAITGEGLSLALHQAPALAAALAAGRPERYARAHRRLRRLPDAVTRLLLALERRPPLRRRAIRVLADDPELFSRLLAILVGAEPVRSLGVGGALRAAWQVLT